MVKSLASSWTESKFENEHGLLSCEKDMLAKMMCIIILKAKITAHTHRQLQHNKQIQSYKLEDEDANLVCRCLPLQIATAYGPTTAEHWAVLFFQTYLAFLLLRPAALNWVHVRSHINSASYTSKLWHRHLDEGVAGTWDILAGNQDIPQKSGQVVTVESRTRILLCLRQLRIVEPIMFSLCPVVAMSVPLSHHLQGRRVHYTNEWMTRSIARSMCDSRACLLSSVLCALSVIYNKWLVQLREYYTALIWVL